MRSVPHAALTHDVDLWQSRALEPAIPLSVLFASLLIVAERFALRPLREALVVARVAL